ncbi:asparagine synthase (glutamine-hydrolyzing) [Dethiosulfatarculus sandiegensis]|uniref:asparagine synthase (glutamine-hydrolyzing) n=1 Tax=Dethiosulfatarculus sandiegensis TaxID=1429043 RepID=A0A0D2HJT1_9BACT|nr:asparagine synthase (glutamine-hydrolyzing) [Dethiosulfatarculus sandiegensis]KIX10913.1 asparagine synthase [Dethiosulfatarculus sandiegensis]
MCGICGFSWEDQDLVREMTHRLKHRGPDMCGDYVDRGVSLGHTRLSIIDLSENGRQPMFNEDKSVVLVTNGEIYNHQDLRSELKGKGHVFYSDSDSESIIHAYEEWGPDCIKRLSGMFCFALLDKKKKRIMLGRDRLGIKPLYYYQKGGDIIFSNEIKAMLAWPGLERRVDLSALYQYLGYEFVPAPRTLFDGVKKLSQGHYALFELENGKLSEHKYWEMEFDPRFSRPEEAVEELRAKLKTAVNRRLMSDVPLGVFLSGGLDSTTVTALMRECGVEHLRTFSIGYPDKSFSELDYAEEMARYYKTDQTVLMIEGLTIEELEKAVYHLDEPMTDLSAIPLMLICRKAKEKVTVVLSGEGGDEIFCGYDRFKASSASRLLDLVPGSARGLHALSRLLPDQPQKKGAVNVLKRFLDGAILPKEGGHLRWQYFLAPGQAESLFNQEVKNQVTFDAFGPIKRIMESCNSDKRLDKEVFGDIKLFMADSVLMKVDKMSMSTSLEVRVPFLDHEVIEFAATLPGSFKLKGMTTKYILRQAIRGLVPDHVVDRGKQGYSLPVKNLLRGQLRPLMEELLRKSPLVTDYMVPQSVEKLMQEHLAGTHNHNHVLWALMNAALWHRRYLEA